MHAFPDEFLWGTATSSHQVEGDNERNDWWDWEQSPEHIIDHTTSGGALGWWAGRAEEDLARAKAFGQNAHRLSLEWSRLEPEPGRFDDAAFTRYEAMLDAARGLALQTLVTVNHFTLPRWFARRGAWLSQDAVERFARFAREVATRLSSRADLWATLNEPNVLAYMAYAGERWPPGLRDMRAAVRAYSTLMRAHAAAYREMKRIDRRAQVGIVLSLPVFDPVRPRKRDRIPASFSDWGFSGAALHALRSGWLMPPLLPGRVPGLKGSFDWLGVNYYGRYTVEFDPLSPEFLGHRPSEGHIKTAWTDWGEPSPDGLTRRLLALARLGVPLYVTENGIRDAEDELRPRFLRDHVSAVSRVIALGADVRGYFHWSLVDNFEWAEGWSSRFGLFALDRATGIRTARASADLYAGICRTNGAVLDSLR